MQERFELFTVLISKISRAIRKIKSQEMVEFNLKTPHVSCLYYIYKLNELTATQLRDICQEDKASISRSIDFLESQNLILCFSSNKKRYNSPLTLTTKGLDIAQKIAKKIDDILKMSSIGLSENELSIMYKGLNTICKNLEKLCKDYGDKK